MEFKQWKKYTIDDVCTVTDCLHKTAPTVNYETQYRMLRTTNIRNGKIDAINTRSVTKETYSDWTIRGILEEDDVILTREAPMGEVGIIKNEQYNLFLGQRLLQLKVNRGIITPDFLYYSLQGRELQHQIGMNEGTGSVVSNIRIPVLKKMEIQVPNLEIQDEITKSLRVLDNKIEINEGIITNLEQLAQTLFKRWFVDFEFPNENDEPYKSSGGEMVESELEMVPVVFKLGELVDLLQFRKDAVKAGNQTVTKAYVPIDVMPMKKISFYNYKSGEEAKSSLIQFEENDILLGAMRVYFHRVCLAPFDGTTRTTCFVLRPHDSNFLYFILLTLFQPDFIDFAETTSKGTTIPYAVWENGIDRYKIAIPSLSIINKFNEMVQPFFEEMKSVSIENKKLEALRETLLPKLISGEIELPDETKDVV